MKHLAIEDILRFVSVTAYNSETVTLAAAVNGHIRHCEACLQRVRAFQTLYDEFEKQSPHSRFHDYVAETLLKSPSKPEAEREWQMSNEDLG